MHVYLQEAPRALVLVGHASSHFALVISTTPGGVFSATSSSSQPSAADLLRNINGSTAGASAKNARKVAAELVDIDEIPLGSLRRVTGSTPASGCLGIMNIGQDLFLSVVTSASQVGAVRPGEVAMRVNAVSFFCINKSTWDNTHVSSASAYGNELEHDPYSPVGVESGGGPGTSGDYSQPSIYEHPCASLRKYMATGTFYFAQDSTWDISTRLDRRIPAAKMREAVHGPGANSKGGDEEHDVGEYDERFVWNSYMLEPLLEYRKRLVEEERENFDTGGFIVSRQQAVSQVRSKADVPHVSAYSSSRFKATLASKLCRPLP